MQAHTPGLQFSSQSAHWLQVLRMPQSLQDSIPQLHLLPCGIWQGGLCTMKLHHTVMCMRPIEGVSGVGTHHRLSMHCPCAQRQLPWLPFLQAAQLGCAAVNISAACKRILLPACAGGDPFCPIRPAASGRPRHAASATMLLQHTHITGIMACADTSNTHDCGSMQASWQFTS